MIKSIITSLGLLFAIYVPAGTPAPDCANAEVLSVTPAGQTCTPFTLDYVNNGSVPANGGRNCQNLTYSVSQVNWKQFTATSSTTILEFGNSRDTNGNNNQSTGLSVFIYTGSCGALTEVACTQNLLTGGDLTLNFGTTVGEVYTIEFSVDNSAIVSADVCLSENAAPTAVNDECTGATGLTLSEICTSQTFTTENATRSRNDCGIWAGDDDVWFSFVANATSATVNFSNASIAGNPQFSSYGAEFLAGDCGILTRIVCSDEQPIGTDYRQTLTGLTINETYYFRVASGANGGAPLTFDVCLTTPPLAPPNDLCGDAQILTLGDPTNGSTVAAGSEDMACGSTTPSGDIWYAFSPDDPTLDLEISDLTNQSENGVRVRYEVLSGECQNTTSLECGNFTESGRRELSTIFVPGEDYFLKLYNVQNRSLDVTFTLERAISLPAELTDFRAEAGPKANYLSWTTAREENVAWFDLERSESGRSDWTLVSKTLASGNTNAPRDYQVSDSEPFVSAYYRLRTVDLDGSEAVSKVLLVNRSEIGQALPLILPNPTNGLIEVVLPEGKRAELLDGVGRILEAIPFVNGQTRFDLSKLPAGLYFVRAFGKNGSTVNRVVRH